MAAICTDTCLKKLSPLVDCSVDSVLLELRPNCNQAFFQFIDDVDSGLIYSLLHHSPHLVVDWVQVGAVWWPYVGISKQELCKLVMQYKCCIIYMHRKCEILIFYVSQGSAATQLRRDGQINIGFVRNLVLFAAVK